VVATEDAPVSVPKLPKSCWVHTKQNTTRKATVVTTEDAPVFVPKLPKSCWVHDYFALKGTHNEAATRTNKNVFGTLRAMVEDGVELGTGPSR
jgi:hypothetical protein